MRLLIALIIMVFALSACGGTSGSGGRFIPNPGGFPVLLGTFTFNFEVVSDPADVMGRLLDDPYVLHLYTTSSNDDISAYDDFGRVWDGAFTSTGGAFTMSTDDEFQFERMEISVVGVMEEGGGSGTFTLTLLEGFGDDNGAVVTGNWEADIV